MSMHQSTADAFASTQCPPAYSAGPSTPLRSQRDTSATTASHSSDSQLVLERARSRPILSAQDPNEPQGPPPAYTASRSPISSEMASSMQKSSPCDDFPSSSRSRACSDFLPCVIPQTSHSALKGTFFSPFTRAYAPKLAAHGISLPVFMTFLDGLNEVFIANPVLQSTSIAGAVMGVVPLQSFRLAGLGLQVGSQLASAGMSYAYTRAYVKKQNETIFLPQGLRVTVVNTKNMMAAIGMLDDGNGLELPALGQSPCEDTDQDMVGAEMSAALNHTPQHLGSCHPDDARMRRIRALDGRVMDLSFDVPLPEAPENVLHKLGAWQAQRLERKQYDELRKQRDKAESKNGKRYDDASEERSKAECELQKVDRNVEKEVRRVEEKMGRKKAMKDLREQEKIEHDLAKELRKLERDREKILQEMEKKVGKEIRRDHKRLGKSEEREQKIANKIHWVLIQQETPVRDDASLNSAEEEKKAVEVDDE